MSAESYINKTLRLHLAAFQRLHKYTATDMASLLGCARKTYENVIYAVDSSPHFNLVYAAAKAMNMSVPEVLTPPAGTVLAGNRRQGHLNNLMALTEQMQRELQAMQADQVVAS